MNTPNAPYRYESHEGDGCMWWTVRCDGSPEILNVGTAVERLNEQHAEIERLREENARLRKATRPRCLADELPPEDMHEALFWDGVRWEMFDNWEGDGWQAEYTAGQLDDLIYWQPLPEPPQ